MFNWDDLRFFLELARKGRLVSAAQRLHVDHTTVSRRIAALEQAMDARLFDKSPQGYQLTEAGQRLLPYAEAMEAESINVLKDISGKDAQLTGTVRLATTEALGSQVVARHLPQFRALHPGIELELIAETRRLSLSKREADIAITLSRPDSGRLIAWKLGTYNLKLYASPGYLESAGPIRTAEDLTSHAFIGYIDDLLQMPELRLIDQLVKDPNFVFRSSNMMAQYNACLEGVGLALLHAFMAEFDDRLRPVLADEIEIRRELWLAVHEDLRSVARVDAVCQFLTELVRDHQSFLMGRPDSKNHEEPIA
ncbi:LysR family transcriptional regulator [Govanella unica]|uniref:LysR family transcriptional regulator n=1 Tax=Govanella unica TaxID=2975056 RepID=A0A9X3Z7K5_9PROT|nr:LysR family transcriptional regulator [Govania unica]MDA5194074.1 LysR family transcriptional regulator [Govania unica]